MAAGDGGTWPPRPDDEEAWNGATERVDVERLSKMYDEEDVME